MSKGLTYRLDKDELGLGLTNADYIAIGRLAVHWSFLEAEIDLIAECLINRPGTTGIDDYLAVAFNKRAAKVKQLFKLLVANQDNQDRLIHLVDRATHLRSQRDQILHGTMSRYGEEKDKIFNKHMRSKVKLVENEYNITTEEINKITSNIYQVFRELQSLWVQELSLPYKSP